MQADRVTIVMLFLTCAHEEEAQKIATYLLEKKLIACAKMMPVSAAFLWQGSLDTAREILLLMDTSENKFDEIEREIRMLHSYTTFVLTAVEVKRASHGVVEWIGQSLELK